MKAAVDDLCPQRGDVRDVLVVFNHRGVGGDIHCSGTDAGQTLQPLLDSEKVENRQHAANLKNSSFHATTPPGLLERETLHRQAGYSRKHSLGPHLHDGQLLRVAYALALWFTFQEDFDFEGKHARDERRDVMITACLYNAPAIRVRHRCIVH
jgi:hypothetical protein